MTLALLARTQWDADEGRHIPTDQDDADTVSRTIDVEAELPKRKLATFRTSNLVPKSILMARFFYTTILLLATMCQSSAAFTTLPHYSYSPVQHCNFHSGSILMRTKKPPPTILSEICNNNHNDDDNDGKPSKKIITGDPLRAASGVRPSLHPTTINALASALKIIREESLTPTADVTAVDVALRAAKIAADAIAARQATSHQDGMTLTKPEEETIAGRVVGVVMRFDTLEQLLCDKIRATSWIAKYGDWDSYGILAEECQTTTSSSSSSSSVRQRIQDDPLFAMTRAECLLALFLETVETPALEQAGQSVPDQGTIDFLDEDRKEVLLGGSSS